MHGNDNFQGKKQPVNTVVTKIAKSASFRAGFLDAKNNSPWPKLSGVYYERGRHFYAWYTTKNYPKAVWRNNQMAKTVQERLAIAFLEGAVI